MPGLQTLDGFVKQKDKHKLNKVFCNTRNSLKVDQGAYFGKSYISDTQ
jgi:hypothetical protein